MLYIQRWCMLLIVWTQSSKYLSLCDLTDAADVLTDDIGKLVRSYILLTEWQQQHAHIWCWLQT